MFHTVFATPTPQAFLSSMGGKDAQKVFKCQKQLITAKNKPVSFKIHYFCLFLAKLEPLKESCTLNKLLRNNRSILQWFRHPILAPHPSVLQHMLSTYAARDCYKVAQEKGRVKPWPLYNTVKLAVSWPWGHLWKFSAEAEVCFVLPQFLWQNGKLSYRTMRQVLDILNHSGISRSKSDILLAFGL